MRKSLRYFLVATFPAWAQVSPTINTSPSREFGQPALLSSLDSIAPNLVEGRELYQPIAVAFDTSASPPILYIVDALNNRVLAYKNPSSLSPCGTGNTGCGFADLQIGQRDLTSTLAGGPGQLGLSTGFNTPAGIAVDSRGSVYVADSGNNRILRFPAPFKQTGSLAVPDLVIGQASLAANQANQGQTLPNAQTVSFNGKIVGLAIDPAGNLWVTDPGNNRVLRFPVNQLAPNTAQPAADVVVGQTSAGLSALPQPPAGTQALLDKSILNAPSGITFDAKGGLYVSDAYFRVLYFPGPFSTGIPASRALGVLVQQTPPLPNVNQYGLAAPQGLATNGTNLFVADTANHRIVEYDVPQNWPAEPALTSGQFPPNSEFSPPMIAAIGQFGLNNGQANQGKPQPGANTLAGPFGLAFSGSDLWVANSGNNRVLDFPLQAGSYTSATHLAGQSNFQYSAPNLIEGREVFFAGGGLVSAAGIVVDQSSSPPHLYIADSNNNRILCFNDARSVSSGSRADLVLGQSGPTDFYDSLVNSGTNLATSPTQTGLFEPIGLAVDSSGNLYVADTGNGRVLRYPAPFAQPGGSPVLPNLVLGQQSFSFSDTDATNQNMHSPWGLAIFSEGSLAVSDSFHSRVLIFKRPAGGDFQNGQVASVVLGQPDFVTTSPSNSAGGMNNPHHIAVDSSDRLYVCDFQNNRVLVYTNTRNSANGAASAFQLNNLSQPDGVIVSQQTGEIYVANYGNDTVVRLPEYDSLILNSTPNSYPVNATIQTQTHPLSVALYSDKADLSDNQIVAEAANRITFFFPQLVFQNAANYNSQPMAPGMLALMYRNGLDFNLSTSYPAGQANNLATPWQTTVNDIQIMVSAPGMTPTPAPIFRVDPTLIAFQVPSNTPPSGVATFVVLHPSTGAIVGEGDFQMAQYSPGFFTGGSPPGTGQVRAFNNLNQGETCSPMPDCVINGPANQIPRDGNHVISFCLTGGGAFQGGAPDGQNPVAANTADPPQLLSGSFPPNGLVPPKYVQYSGAGCFFPGGWQVNFLVPSLIPPGNNNVIALSIGDIPSSTGPNGTIQVWFATK